MAGLLTVGAVLLCNHGGAAETVVSDLRVSIGGEPVVTEASFYLVSGCPNSPPPELLPCASANFITAATRIKVSGQPVLLATSEAVCVPTGTGLIVTVNQVRVTGE
jgi:hypothetical protein